MTRKHLFDQMLIKQTVSATDILHGTHFVFCV